MCIWISEVPGDELQEVHPCRPGRLGKMLLVPLPSAEGRCAILKTLTRSKPLASNLDLDSIAMDARCSGFSGADLSALVHAAVLAAIRVRCSLDTASSTVCGACRCKAI